jgi:hypothetical protein
VAADQPLEPRGSGVFTLFAFSALKCQVFVEEEDPNEVNVGNEGI